MNINLRVLIINILLVSILVSVINQSCLNKCVRETDSSKVSAQGSTVKIIFDTDIHTDVDDVGALAVLHALADRGECDILAVICSTKDPFSASTADAINTYYGRPDIPIGIVKGEGVLRQSKYTRDISMEFPHDFKSDDTAPDAAFLYREIIPWL